MAKWFEYMPVGITQEIVGSIYSHALIFVVAILD